MDNLWIDEIPSKRMNNKAIEVVKMAKILVIICLCLAFTRHKNVMMIMSNNCYIIDENINGYCKLQW